MTVLQGFRVAQIGPGLAASVCGRLLADAGATVVRINPDTSSLLREHLNHAAGPADSDTQASPAGIAAADLPNADLIICEGSPATLRQTGCDPQTLHQINPTAALVLISPFGQTGPRSEEPATDLTLFFASGIARMLTGQVDDLAEPPLRPPGEQASFIGGLAAACAGMHAALLGNGAVADVSIHEALATLAITELARAGLGGKSWSRERLADGNGATVCILPARDGFAAISPREDRQWASWLRVMGSPAWGGDPRLATKLGRIANWDALHALMSDWSRPLGKQCIADTAQAAHVPSFPLREPLEHLKSAQLQHRKFFQARRIAGQPVQVPGSPFGLTLAPSACIPPAPGPRPLAGVRVLDFSWVIAGPTATRTLAAMGAEVIKVEAPGQGDPARASKLHTVLGQAKKSVVLDLKKPQAIEIARALAARSDVLVENFATGVMDRLGLGPEALRAINPNLIYVSASGLGRTGPEANAVAYGTLLQCYAGFAGLNRHPGLPPRVGMAWLDPMCGLMLAFIVAASLWRRRTGAVARVDFSMIEAMLWTMAEPLLATQVQGEPAPPDTVLRCAGADDWLGVDAADPKALHPVAPNAGLAAWAASRNAAEAAARLIQAGIPAAPLARSTDLAACDHLRQRGFWDASGTGLLPGLPWQASFGKATGPAPGLGVDTNAVLGSVLGMTPADMAALRQAGASGQAP